MGKNRRHEIRGKDLKGATETGLVTEIGTEIGPVMKTDTAIVTKSGHEISLRIGLRSVLDPRIAIEIATEDEMITLKNYGDTRMTVGKTVTGVAGPETEDKDSRPGRRTGQCWLPRSAAVCVSRYRTAIRLHYTKHLFVNYQYFLFRFYWLNSLTTCPKKSPEIISKFR